MRCQWTWNVASNYLYPSFATLTALHLHTRVDIPMIYSRALQ